MTHGYILEPTTEELTQLQRVGYSWFRKYIYIDMHAPFWHGCLTNIHAVDFQTTRLQKFCQNSDHVRARE